MEHYRALIEWESGGLGDVPTENMRWMFDTLLAEFAKRGVTPEPIERLREALQYTITALDAALFDLTGKRDDQLDDIRALLTPNA